MDQFVWLSGRKKKKKYLTSFIYHFREPQLLCWKFVWLFRRSEMQFGSNLGV